MYHDFGDRDIYDHVTEQDDDERDVSKQVIEDQNAEEQDFEGQNVRGPAEIEESTAAAPSTRLRPIHAMSNVDNDPGKPESK